MDNFADGVSAPDLAPLSLDSTVPYGGQLPAHPSQDPEQVTLLNRIGNTKAREGYGFRSASGMSTPLTMASQAVDRSSPLPDLNGLGWPGTSSSHSNSM
jgi:hypothetical protein